MSGSEQQPPPAPLSTEELARAHRRLGEHLHDVEEHLLDIADRAADGDGAGGEGGAADDPPAAIRRRAHRLSTDAERELERADELDGHRVPRT